MVFFISQQCKILTYTRSPREASELIAAVRLIPMISSHLQDGWKLVNCESNSLGQVSREAGMYFIAYLVKD